MEEQFTTETLSTWTKKGFDKKLFGQNKDLDIKLLGQKKIIFHQVEFRQIWQNKV